MACRYLIRTDDPPAVIKRLYHELNCNQGGMRAMSFGNTTPILRIFDEAKAKEFYVEFLGFEVDWQHRFEDNLPLYMQISKDACVIHLSEHHGDCSPGAALRIQTNELEGFHGSCWPSNTSTRARPFN
jgi:Glyoxalase superfamily protein